MGVWRLCKTARYRSIFRWRFMSYILLLLLGLVVWTYHSRWDSDQAGPLPALRPEHVHQDLAAFRTARPPDDGGQKAAVQHVRHVAAFSGPRTYAANHSHPVLPLPPVADFMVKPETFQQQCVTIRMVEFFGQKLIVQGEPICQWLQGPSFQADDRFIVYGNKMALLYDVVLDPASLEPGPRGGESMHDVWGQTEDLEYFRFKPGFFALECRSRPQPEFGLNDHLNHWVAALACRDNVTMAGLLKQAARSSRGLTVAVQRYEYVNLYHTMTDFYNAFLAMLLFNQHPDDVTLLFVDAHPKGGLDDTWRTLFGQVQLAGRLEGLTHFPAMVWSVMGYNSPINEHDRPSVPYLEEFRHFFLSRHGVSGSRQVDCSRLNWLFIWRRDYVAHPRNQEGSVSRKIFNEDELLEAITKVIPVGDTLQGLQLDALPMKEQLQLIVSTDVLLGMHGAGLSHTLFLPPHAALLEFYPTYWPQANRHFRAFAGWRRLHYQTWQNEDPDNERPNHLTYIPPAVVVNMVKEARRNICG